MTGYDEIPALGRLVFWNGASSAGSPAFRAPEKMVKCVRCGVNQPISESVVVDGRYYCCLDHAHDAEERGG